jgi:zinc protease
MSIRGGLWSGLLLLFSVTTYGAPPIQSWETANGARVLFVAAPELPMVDVRVVFDAGSARDGASPGLARLTNRLLADGAGGMDANAIADAFAQRGAQFGSGSGRDTASVSLRSLTDPELLRPAVEVLALLLRDPTFSDAGFRREKARLLTGVRQEQQEPDEIAEKRFYAAAYQQHPYSSPPTGTEQSLETIARAQVADFHRRYYVARNAVVAIVGAVTRPQAEALANEVVGGLPEGESAAPLPEVAGLNGQHLLAIEFPSTQTHVRLGQPALRRDDPDFFPLYVGNHILGGSGLVSRLSKAVREERGLAYSVYSYIAPMLREGPFVMGLQTKNAQTTEAIELLRANLNRFVTEGPTDEELAAAKKNIIGGFPLRIDSNADVAEYLTVIGFYRLPLDYLDTFTQRIAEVTREQIMAAFARRIDPGKLVMVRVGEAAKAE